MQTELKVYPLGTKQGNKTRERPSRGKQVGALGALAAYANFHYPWVQSLL